MEPTAAPALEQAPAPAPGAPPPPPPPSFADLPAAAVARVAAFSVPNSLPSARDSLDAGRAAVALMAVCSAWRAAAEEPLRAGLDELHRRPLGGDEFARWPNVLALMKALAGEADDRAAPGWLPPEFAAEAALARRHAAAMRARHAALAAALAELRS